MISIHKKDYGPQPGSFEPAIHLGKQEETANPRGLNVRLYLENFVAGDMTTASFVLVAAI